VSVDLVNEFHVALPIGEAWTVLTDLERIAPCMPGAQLQSVEGETFHGTVKVKVGPITAQYKGTAVFEERDEAAHRAVIKAEGRESRGQGNASARITAELSEDATGTIVKMSTDLAISGKAAQFGRGVLAEVSGKLLQQFVRQLEADLLTGDAATAAAVEPAPEQNGTEAAQAEAAQGEAVPAPVTPAVAPPTVAIPLQPVRAYAPAAPDPAETSINVLSIVALPLAKRAAPVLGALLVLYLLLKRRAR
jgi:carbon monoxide dehydrogenase subunit G